MDITPELIGRVAGVLAFIQVIPYIISIFRGHTKPNRASFAIWSVVNMVSMSTYIAAGATTTIWLNVAFSVTPIAIFLLSLKYGMGGFSKLDISCLAIAFMAVAIWITTDDAVTALYANLIAATLGFLPTIKKAYYLPQTENALSWGLTGIASILNMFALTTLTPKIALSPILTVAGNTLIAFLVVSAAFHFRKAPRGPKIIASRRDRRGSKS